MTGDQIAQFLWLGLLAVALGGWLLFQLRGNLNRTLQQLAIWALIFIGVIAAYGMWNDIRGQVIPMQATMADGRVEIPMRRDGHYHATLQINGANIEFIVDTGASDIVLSQADARKIGLDLDSLIFAGRAQTANGSVQTAPVTLDEVQLGGVIDRNVRAVVNGGQMDSSLLGMAYLHRFSRIEIAEGQLILTR